MLVSSLLLSPCAVAGATAEHPAQALTVEVPAGWVVEIHSLADDNSHGAYANLELKRAGVRISIHRMGAVADTLEVDPPIPEEYLPFLIGHLSRTWKVQYGAPQRVTLPTGEEALWAAAPGATTPYIGLVRRDGQTFSVAVSLDPPAAGKSPPPGTQDAFLRVLRTVRPMADRVPAAGEPAFGRASRAITRGDWASAIEELAKAPKTFPPVLLSLGVAHANAGRPLSALAWLAAYDASMRDSPSHPGARLQLELKRLEQAVEAKISRILDAADRAAKAMVSSGRTEAVVRIAAARVQAGDIRGLRDQVLAGNPAFQARVWFGYAFNRALAGDLPGIRDALDGAAAARGQRDADWRSRADSLWVAAVVSSAYEGNRPQAEAALREIQRGEKRKEGEDLVGQLCHPRATGRALLEEFAGDAAKAEPEVEQRLEAAAKASDPNRIVTEMLEAASAPRQKLASIRSVIKRSALPVVSCGRR